MNLSRKFPLSKISTLLCLILVIGLIFILISILELKSMQAEHWERAHGYPEGEVGLEQKTTSSLSHPQGPILWVKAKRPTSGYLSHIFAVFSRLGYHRVISDTPPKEGWDVLWHHDYPFLNKDMRPLMQNLEPWQRVNHIPGSGFYTSKVDLATSNVTIGIPPAFGLPKQKAEFEFYASRHPKKLWVQKNNNHRGIKIKKTEEVDTAQENSFVQEYIDKPLLIEGRKFDIGIYTVVTSTVPLRVYIYEGDSLLRFCPKPYHPFDPKDVDKYVVGDDYTPIWKIPALSKYYTDLQYTWKGSLDAYLRDQGKDPQKIWKGVRNAIRGVLLAQSHKIQPLIDNYKYRWNFFELSRFDFVVDEDLNVYLMEANMSPNLSSGHFPPNKNLYEQVLFNLLSLNGLIRQLYDQMGPKRGSKDEQQMLISDKDLQVFPEHCGSKLCSSCSDISCKLCHPCLSTEMRQALRQAYSEHVNRLNMRRIIPSPIESTDSRPSDVTDLKASKYLSYMQSATEEDRLLDVWFRGKCIQDAVWCQ